MRTLKCIHLKLDMTGTAIEMHLLLFKSIKRPFQIPVAHFDQNRTIKWLTTERKGKYDKLNPFGFGFLILSVSPFVSSILFHQNPPHLSIVMLF